MIAKSGVAPIKFIGIFQLDLCATVMAFRVGNLISSKLRLAVDGVYLWTDLATVLSWINSKSLRFHVYVSNRLGEILDSS